MKIDPHRIREALRDGREILVGIAKQIAPGARELVGTPFEVTSVIVGERIEPYFASIWLPIDQGFMTIEEVRIGGFRIDKLKGSRAFSPDGWLILRIADPLRLKTGDDILLGVRNAAGNADVERLAPSMRGGDAREFRAMLGFVIDREKPLAPLVIT